MAGRQSPTTLRPRRAKKREYKHPRMYVPFCEFGDMRLYLSSPFSQSAIAYTLVPFFRMFDQWPNMLCEKRLKPLYTAANSMPRALPAIVHDCGMDKRCSN